jgi:hypothetical protein
MLFGELTGMVVESPQHVCRDQITRLGDEAAEGEDIAEHDCDRFSNRVRSVHCFDLTIAAR